MTTFERDDCGEPRDVRRGKIKEKKGIRGKKRQEKMN